MVYVEDVVSAFFAACERPEAAGRGHDRRGPAALHAARADRRGAPGHGQRALRARLPLAPMLAAAAVVEDVCQVLHVDPPIYRRRMDFFTSDSAFDTPAPGGCSDWAPRVELAEGMRRTLDDYRARSTG